jgi:hypothetical protein
MYLFRVVVTSLSVAPSGAIGTKVPTNGDIRPYFEASVDGSRRFIRLSGVMALLAAFGLWCVSQRASS